VAPKGVGVQIPPSAPFALITEQFLPGQFLPDSFLPDNFGLASPFRIFNSMLIGLVTVVHVMVCLFLIIVVLLQSGKAGDISAAFGGQGSQAAFGPRGAATALSKATTISAVLFMLTSVTLSVNAIKHGGPNSVLQGVKSAPAKTQPAAPAPTPAPAPNQK
jgi:preprotein translocase subunit SecG